LRVMESMLMKRPLISDCDPRSGMDLLFEPWVHYIPYQAYTYAGLEEAMAWTIEHPVGAGAIADAAYEEVRDKHLVSNRIIQIMEVVENG
jgi:spore maturation protein CgeB